MDFVAVPAGTARVAALALRGADPSLSFATADSFNTTLGDTLCAVAGAPGRMEAAYSNVAAELVGALFTNDAAVLDSATILSVINPAKLRAVWLRLVADGLDDAASLSGSRFRYERDNVLAGLDYTALAVGYLVTAADLFLTQASAGALGGAATLWVRSATIRAFASPVRGQPGLYSLAPLADLYRFAPGIFHTATRDLVDSPFRLVLEESQRRAQDARMPYAALASASPLNTARAAAQAFIATAPPGRNWELYGPNGTPGDLTRRSQDWSDRCSLAGAIGAGGGGHTLSSRSCAVASTSSRYRFHRCTRCSRACCLCRPSLPSWPRSQLGASSRHAGCRTTSRTCWRSRRPASSSSRLWKSTTSSRRGSASSGSAPCSRTRTPAAAAAAVHRPARRTPSTTASFRG